MQRKITAYGNYYKDFFDTQDKGTQEKVLYGLLLLKTQDRLPAKFVKPILNTENAGEGDKTGIKIKERIL